MGQPTAEGGNQKVKVKVRINHNGIFGVASASLVEKHEIGEEVPVEMEVDEKKEDAEKKEGAGEEKMEGDEKAEAKPAAEDKMETRKKTVNKTIELPVSSRVQGQLSFDKLQAATTSETMMAKADRDEAERLNSKNSVEEYIYEIRGKICDELEDFMLEGDREKFSRELTDSEDWLYEDGEFADKKTYTEKLATLRKTGESVRKRRREFMERPEAINQFGQCMQLAQKAVDSFKAGDEKFNHLDAAEVEKVQKAIAEKQDWFNRMCADVSKMDKTSDPPVLASQFYQEKESFWHMASNILNKPKPKVEPPPPPPTQPAKEEGMETEGKQGGSESKPSEEAPQQKQAEMDVD